MASSSQSPRAETAEPQEAGHTLARRVEEPRAVETFDSLGSTDIGAGDIEMPRLKLLQGLSQAVVEQKAPAGSFYNSLSDEAYGDQVLIVPVVGFKNRVLLRVGKGLQCRSLDMENGIGDPGIKCAQCSLKDWPDDRRRNGEDVPANVAGPECRVSHNWLVLVVGGTGLDGKPGTRQLEMFAEPQWAVMAWTGTSSKAAKKLNGLRVQHMTMKPGAQWFDRVYKVGASNVRGEKGNYFVPDIALHGPATDEFKTAARQLSDFMRGKQISYEYEPDEDPEAAATVAHAPTGADTDF